MAYIESYVLPVETARLADYVRIAQESALIWRDLGALSVIEATAENAPIGELTSFPRAVLAKPDETIVVAYVTFQDRAHRDEVMAKMEQDSRMLTLFSSAPVDGKRMIWGGFDVVVSA